MNLADVARRLSAAGVSPSSYALGTRPYEGLCLLAEAGVWKVFYTERGHDSPPDFVSADEAAACQYYLDLVLRQRFRHCVAVRPAIPDAEAVRDFLRQQGIAAEVNHLRLSAERWRHEVCVLESDVAAAHRLLGQEPASATALPKPEEWTWLRRLFR